MCSPDEKTTSEQCDYKVSGLAVYGTDAALECGSQNALTSHGRAQKRRAFVSQAHQQHHSSNRTTCTCTDVQRDQKRRLKNTQKDAHVEHRHTQKLQGYFDLICLCYSSWKRLVLKATRCFCMRGDDWNCSASLYFCPFSLCNFHLLSFSICYTLSHWPASNVNCSLCLSLSLVFSRSSGPLHK